LNCQHEEKKKNVKVPWRCHLRWSQPLVARAAFAPANLATDDGENKVDIEVTFVGEVREPQTLNTKPYF
jgi:hypothetical protein